MKIDEKVLYEKLSPLAARRDLGFHMDGSSYPKCSRSLGPARKELDEASLALVAMVELATNGFPDVGGMRNVFARLQQEYNIFELAEEAKKDQEIVWSKATLATDRWKTQLRHVVELKKMVTRRC